MDCTALRGVWMSRDSCVAVLYIGQVMPPSGVKSRCNKDATVSCRNDTRTHTHDQPARSTCAARGACCSHGRPVALHGVRHCILGWRKVKAILGSVRVPHKHQLLAMADLEEGATAALWSATPNKQAADTVATPRRGPHLVVTLCKVCTPGSCREGHDVVKAAGHNMKESGAHNS